MTPAPPLAMPLLQVMLPLQVTQLQAIEAVEADLAAEVQVAAAVGANPLSLT